MDLLKKFWLLLVALGSIGLGFLLLSADRLSLGPLLLVAGYCVLLPSYLWQNFQHSVGE